MLVQLLRYIIMYTTKPTQLTQSRRMRYVPTRHNRVKHLAESGDLCVLVGPCEPGCADTLYRQGMSDVDKDLR